MPDLATEFAKRRALRPIADLICHYIKVGPADELEHAISDGWSLVDQVKREPREKLLATVDDILKSYPDVKGVIDALRKNPPAAPKSDSNDFLAGLDVDRLIALILRQLPEHGAVLIRHTDWVSSEISRVQELLH